MPVRPASSSAPWRKPGKTPPFSSTWAMPTPRSSATKMRSPPIVIPRSCKTAPVCAKRSSPRKSALIDSRRRTAAFVLVLGVVSATGCRQQVAGSLQGGAAQAAFDSLLSAAMPQPLAASGDALLDVEQYRFRGHVNLKTTVEGDAAIELSGSSLFGGHREDVAVSLADDTLRVLDRERGRFYEGDSLDDLLWEGTEARANWPLVVERMLALPGSGEGLQTLAVDENGARGATAEGTIRLDVDRGRLQKAVWPNPIASATFDDRLEVEYAWEGERLREITATLPERGWRVRFRFSN